MRNRSLLAAAIATLATSVAVPVYAAEVFNRISTFSVAENLPPEIDAKTPTSSEIISATDDGLTLVYSDSPLGAIGFINITDPKTPKVGGIVKIDGEPTSVVVAGSKVLAGVNTSKTKQEPSGNLSVIDIASRQIEKSCDLGGQPDSIALSNDGKFLAVAIENERDEDLNEGALPQLPTGNLKIISVTNNIPDCATIRTVELTGLAEIAPEDAEPEFVAFNDAGEIAVTLQENNHIAIVDAETGTVVSHFSAGSVSFNDVDTKKDGKLSFSGKVENAPREPDAVKWIDNNRLVTANEGDYKGGTRGFTIFSKSGEVLHENGSGFEYVAANLGHYPEHRNKKGIEPEGLEISVFGENRLIFVGSERASLVGIYEDTGSEPKFLQALPSGIGPEGLVAIPSRNLFITANETDLVEDGGARSHVMVFERAEGTPAYPLLEAALTDEGKPLGWGALSGLAADPQDAGKLYAVSDSVYGAQPSVFTIDAATTPARILAKTLVTRGGNAAQKLDLEGIASDGNGGFWLANEGDAAKLTPHAIFRIDDTGEIKQEIALPAKLLANETRFGLEGITTIGTGDDLILVMAMQREWQDDTKGEVKLLSYKPKDKEWAAVRYPLEATDDGWVGLSEITAYEGKLYIVERDNLIGSAAKVKRLYSVSLDGFKPAALDTPLPLVEKTLVRDLLPDMKNATNGYVVDKVEGFTIDKAGEAFVVTDNDGVDGSSGETLFIRLGNIAAIN